jgi:Cu2+-exporting ATPase
MAELSVSHGLVHGAPVVAPSGEERIPYVAVDADGTASLHLLVDGVHCANCIARIERTLLAFDDVMSARVNFSTRRLTICWRGAASRASQLIDAVEALGYLVTPYDPELLAGRTGAEETMLLRAIGVSGFAAANVMLLSVSVWVGLWSDMQPVTRDLLHWVSALIALPAVAYAGQPFFRSALRAVRAGRVNMDVPISLAVVLAAAVSLVETIGGGEHTYFDASITLVFFLLVGRYLDQRARSQARSAAERLLLLRAATATLVEADGRRRIVATDALEPGLRVAVAAGDRVPADGTLVMGHSDIDASLVTGESLPQNVGPGDRVFAGTVNLTGAVEMRVSDVGEATLLGQIARLVELAEQGRSRYVRLAERVARLYAPTVHLLAAATFAGWLLLGAAEWQTALLYAVAVLIITCPCALGLAVPAVQVVASGRLLERGILLKSSDGLERLATADTVVFDKTGTLTLGRPELINRTDIAPELFRIAGRLAAASKHPLSRSLAACADDVAVADDVRETPGSGLEGDVAGVTYRLGSRQWCCASDAVAETYGEGPCLWLSREGQALAEFHFRDTLRSDAADVVAELKRQGLRLELLSGDRPEIVAQVATALGLDIWQAACTPADKAAHLEVLARQGRRVLMIGDGLNDAPALAGAHVSLSPASAADISQISADFVFQGDRLQPVLEALEVSRRARRLTLQNLGLALAYNTVAIPFAVAGLVTPLIAAVAMSSSSLLVTGNALRLKWKSRRGAS